MAGEEPTDETEEKKKEGPSEATEEKKTSKAVISVIFLLVAMAAVSIYSTMQPVGYKYTSTVAGVSVHSQIPLEELQYRENVALYNNSDPAAVTCNFELSAISIQDRLGYKILIEQGEQGIYIQTDKAYIRGMNYEETLQTCNIFSCLREGIECPSNLWSIRDSILKEKKINIAIDNELRGSAVQGYGDIMGALGYIQAENQMEDIDGNGRIENWELEESLIKIFPYIMEGDECKLQPITTGLQKLNATNETYNCRTLSPAIILQKADENKIDVNGDRMTIMGDDEHVGSAAIIVRDVISPELIRSLYGLD
ncbi:MAG: hypothetical protein JW778_07420 [Candidatus Altiarchaeota archaeon]|nr:hypothetical protein [Candidatus Altiarchaeota archaeon]